MQQWHAPAAALRAAGVTLDVLYVADPSNSFYLQDPGGGWDGIRHFGAIVRPHAAQYEGRVLMVGSSMGATACLQHADLATRALALRRASIWTSRTAPSCRRRRARRGSPPSTAASPRCRPHVAVTGGGNSSTWRRSPSCVTRRASPSSSTRRNTTTSRSSSRVRRLVPLLRSEVAATLHGAICTIGASDFVSKSRSIMYKHGFAKAAAAAAAALLGLWLVVRLLLLPASPRPP